MQFGTINTVPDGCLVRYTNRVNKPSAHYRPLNCLENSERVYFQALFCSCSALGKPAAFRNRVTLLEQPVIWRSGASSSKHSNFRTFNSKLRLLVQSFQFRTSPAPATPVSHCSPNRSWRFQLFEHLKRCYTGVSFLIEQKVFGVLNLLNSCSW